MRRLALLAALLLSACSDKTPDPGCLQCGGEPVDGAPPDGDAQSCPPCGRDMMCVERFDGTCHTDGPMCIPVELVCATDACDPDCEAALCGAPYQCQDRVTCGTETPGAFTCYGP
jgi:hypothetical protein